MVIKQEYAVVHSSNHTKSFLKANNIKDLDWRGKCTDRNIIENLWGHLEPREYANGPQYNSVVDLQDSIFDDWISVDLHYVQSIYDSIPSCLISVVENQVEMINY